MQGAVPLNVYADGGTKPYPAIAVYVRGIAPKLNKYSYRLAAPYIPTNNEAEYEAILAAVKLAPANVGNKGEIKKITINSDSQLAVNQINGNWKIRELHLQKYRRRAIDEMGKSKHDWELKWIPREMNPAGKMLEDLKNEYPSYTLTEYWTCYPARGDPNGQPFYLDRQGHNCRISAP